MKGMLRFIIVLQFRGIKTYDLFFLFFKMKLSCFAISVPALFHKFVCCVCVCMCCFGVNLEVFFKLLKLWQLRQLNQRGNYCAIKLETSYFYKTLTVWMIYYEPQKGSSKPIYSDTECKYTINAKKTVLQVRFPHKIIQICIWIKSHTGIDPF